MNELTGGRAGPLIAAAAAVLSFLVGLALAMIGEKFGPLVMLVLPGIVFAAGLILAKPVRGLTAIYLSFPAGFLSLPTDALGIQATEAMVLLVIGLVGLRRVGSGLVPLSWAPELWVPVAMIGWAILGVPGAADYAVAIKQTAQLVGGLLVALATLAVIRTSDDVRGVLGWLLVVGTGMAAFGLRSAGELEATFGGAVAFNRAAGIFPHPNDFAAFSAILLLIGAAWLFAGRTRASRIAGGLAALVFLLALTVSLSRGAWVGALGGVVVLLILLPRARRGLLFAGIPIILTGTILVSSAGTPDQPQVRAVRQRIESIARPTANPYDSRPDIYREAIRQIRAHPLTGVGAGNFPVASAASGSLTQTVGAVHAHNVLLTVAAETGIPSAVLLLLFTVLIGLAALRTVRRLPDARDRALAAGVAAALAVQIGQGIVDFNFRNPIIPVLMWSLIGILLALRRGSRSEEERWPTPSD